MRKISRIVIMLLAVVLLCTSCNKSEEYNYLKIDPNIQKDYVLEEIDLEQVEIGNPAGICIYDGSIYVCDTINNCIVRMNKDLEVLETYGTLGMENGNFSKPMDITYSNGSFYVLDNGNNRVQKFDSEFGYVETYNLGHLYSEQGLGKYLSIAVGDDGIVYVSTFSPDNKDAYIFCWNNNTWETIGQNVIGYLSEWDESVYYVTMLEFHIEEKKTSARSGKNALFQISQEKMKMVARMQDKYAPIALHCWNGDIYMISGGEGCINKYSDNSEVLETLSVLPESSLFMYMNIDDEGNIYITDNENALFYRLTK